MKNVMRLLSAIGFILSGVSAPGGCWVDMYWPLNGGNRWQFTRDVTVGIDAVSIDDMGGGEFWVTQETPHSSVYEIHYKVQGNVYLDCVDSGYIRVCVSPDVLLFDDDLLQRGGSRTTRTTASQPGAHYPATFTVTISTAGTVTVPAGTFQNCRNITVKETAYPPGQGAVSKTALTAVLAPRVGMIKKLVAIDNRLVWVELMSGTVGGMNVTNLAGLSGSLPPGITTHPRNTTVTNNGVVTLTASASGQNLSYQWLKDGAPLSDDGRVNGSGSSTLRLDPVQYSDAGAYAVRVGNSVCSVTSSNALLSVLLVDLLVLRTNGLGGIAPGFKGNLLLLGSTQTVTAIPQTGQVFSNWTDGAGVDITNHPTCKFIMRSNLVLIANFVSNPFPAVAGSYSGLFHESNSAEHRSSGSFKAKVQSGGAFSASLQTGVRKYPFTGRFGVNGKAANIVARRGTNSLMVDLALDFSGSEQITGRVTDGTWTSELLADRATFNAVSNPATSFAGQYTMVIPGGTNSSAAEPAGDGVAAVTISRAGVATFKSTLADGTPAVVAVAVSKAGDVPWYLPLYGGGGSALGWLRLAPAPEVDLNGQVVWLKPAPARSHSYTNGFVLESFVVGSFYTPFGTNPLFNAAGSTVAFTDGGLANPFENAVAFGPNGRVTNGSPNRLTFKAVSATGLFSGTVLPPGAAKLITFRGALLQRQGYGGGFFLNTNQSGRVRLGP
jgi:hypothetical protein